MKLNVISDLHLSMQGLDIPHNDADVVVLAGDVSRPREAVQWATSLGKPVLYVPGNHEFYGGSLDQRWNDIISLCEGTKITPLQMSEVVIGDVRFLGATLWTDFELFFEDHLNAEARAQGGKLMRDFSRIQSEVESDEFFTPQQSAMVHASHKEWLKSKLAHPHRGPTVVITHHAPSPKSINPRFGGSLLNACFVSDCEELLDGDSAVLWVHGHTHDSFDYEVNGTRVVCNPRGYFKKGVNENALFNPNLIVEV